MCHVCVTLLFLLNIVSVLFIRNEMFHATQRAEITPDLREEASGYAQA